MASTKYTEEAAVATEMITEAGALVTVTRYVSASAYDPITDSPDPSVAADGSDEFLAYAVVLPLSTSQIQDIRMEKPAAVLSEMAKMLLTTDNMTFPVEPGMRVIFSSAPNPTDEIWSIDSLVPLNPDMGGNPLMYTMVVSRGGGAFPA